MEYDSSPGLKSPIARLIIGLIRLSRLTGKERRTKSKGPDAAADRGRDEREF